MERPAGPVYLVKQSLLRRRTKGVAAKMAACVPDRQDLTLCRAPDTQLAEAWTSSQSVHAHSSSMLSSSSPICSPFSLFFSICFLSLFISRFLSRALSLLFSPSLPLVPYQRLHFLSYFFPLLAEGGGMCRLPNSGELKIISACCLRRGVS